MTVDLIRHHFYAFDPKKSPMRAARDDAIAAVAYALLEQHGFAGTTMQSIARDAHAAMETPYRWYGNKTALDRARKTAHIAHAIDTEAAQGLSGLRLLARLGPVLPTMLLGPRAISLNRAAADAIHLRSHRAMSVLSRLYAAAPAP